MDYTGKGFAEQANNGGYIGIPYKKLDCQAFVEKVLADYGVKNPATGKPYNWRGSNDMWRNAVDCRIKKTEGVPIPVGAWLFTIRDDGGEKERGYNDDYKNAAHVGIYIGDGNVIHSTTGGVQRDVITSTRWTHFALAKCLIYSYPSERDCGMNCKTCWKEVGTSGS